MHTIGGYVNVEMWIKRKGKPKKKSREIATVACGRESLQPSSLIKNATYRSFLSAVFRALVCFLCSDNAAEGVRYVSCRDCYQNMEHTSGHEIWRSCLVEEQSLHVITSLNRGDLL